jgi:glycine cleavage system aminomethyltransferase T
VLWISHERVTIKSFAPTRSATLDSGPEFKRSPYREGLGWLVNLQGQDFVGKQALQDRQNAGHRWVLIILQIDLAEWLE